MSYELRDFNDPKYKKWRIAVFIRDNFACRLCGIFGPLAKLQAHHIQRWADFPLLRYVIKNGITLCSGCHGLVTGNEESYAERFINMVNKPVKRSDVDAALIIQRKLLK
jgi:5-methylcytosine-specific restriction endonuclease McrA